ncbi:MAG: hypothetical protein ACLQPH_01675 [Acidimicrobiales bacterium]
MVVVNPKRLPTQDEAPEAVGRLLAAVETGVDIFDALNEIRALHPKNNTFPGEIFIRLAADALDEGGVGRKSPIAGERLVEEYLPECQFRGRDNQKMRYALLAASATQAGVEVDLLEEVGYWATDDFWMYAGYAAVVWIRAVAGQRAIALPEFCGRLRVRSVDETAGH